ncbi:MFS transporter [Actinomadura alba]|uniref:MFS transporter n=1 Tax=Actinomadura alba TaxID=406431 RepID=A0ABR7LPN6_9ACTN|nr:MFS transporter [Actinomadura alba]MBC6466749.1 MFS transporter [Actinomadura alba]
MTATSAEGAVLRPLRHSGFRNLTLGRTMTHCANSMAPVALAFAVLDMTGSAIDVGLVVGTRSVANILLVLFGGLMADRLPRALILQGASLSAAAVQAAVAVTLLTGSGSLSVLILLSAVNGAMAAVSLPASASLTPQTVPQEDLRAANAVARMGVNIGMIAGASLGGMITAVFGPGWGIMANAVAFTMAALAYHGVRVPRAANTAASSARPLHELREGWREFTARAWVWVVVLQFFVINAVMAGGIQVIGPTIADSTYGRTAWGLALAVQMAGALVGGFLVARYRARHTLRIGVALVALDALPLLTLADAAPLALLMTAMFINGLALEQFGVAWDLSLQENIPADRLARVYSYDVLGSILAMPIGEMTAGALSERFGNRATLLGGAGLIVGVTALALCSRQVRSLTTGAAHEDIRPVGAKSRI